MAGDQICKTREMKAKKMVPEKNHKKNKANTKVAQSNQKVHMKVETVKTPRTKPTPMLKAPTNKTILTKNQTPVFKEACQAA